jgi:hypothetical protein
MRIIYAVTQKEHDMSGDLNNELAGTGFTADPEFDALHQFRSPSREDVQQTQQTNSPGELPALMLHHPAVPDQLPFGIRPDLQHSIDALPPRPRPIFENTLIPMNGTFETSVYGNGTLSRDKLGNLTLSFRDVRFSEGIQIGADGSITGLQNGNPTMNGFQLQQSGNSLIMTTPSGHRVTLQNGAIVSSQTDNVVTTFIPGQFKNTSR